uniref:Uncharacterized protein n=1 Tax=Oryza punctata TaxID=4537 RepID=A0A0E0KA84_ORYPU
MSADEAMAVLIKLMSSLFGSPQSDSTIKRLSLSFCLLIDLVTSLNELICNAVDSGKVKSMELAITTDKRSVDYTTEDRDPCEDSEAMDSPIYPSTSMFPQNNDEKSTIMKQLKAGINRPVEIIFC